MNEIHETGKLLKGIFCNNWNEDFIFDGINDKKISFSELLAAILRYKKKFQELNLKNGDILCLIAPNCVDYLVFFFVSLMMKLTIVPIDPYKGNEEISEILSYVNPRYIISETKLSESNFQMLDINFFRKDLYRKENIDKNQLDVFESLDYDKTFLITFTSGSTGTPKGVMHSFNNLVKSAVSFNKKFNFNKENIFYHNLPMSYMAGILNLIILPLISECKIVLGERFEISKIATFWNIPIRYSVNTFWFIPTILELLLKLDRGTKGICYTKNNSIIGCVGTAPLSHRTKWEFEEKYGIKLYESYGLSETLLVSTNFPSKDKSGTVGKILDDIELKFRDDNEVIINTPWMFLGYLNLENEDKFLEDGKYRTGDFGNIDEEGFLKITGRKKDLIIKGGINISPKRIEDFISNFNLFEECVVLGIADQYLIEKTVCFFIPNQYYKEHMKKNLNRDISEKLGRDYHIDEFIALDDLPKNSNGKIDKSKIREIYSKK